MTKIQDNKIILFIKKYQTCLAFAAIGLVAIVLLRSAFFSISTPDESFYLTIPYRLTRGDSLMVDEWHASQFSSFLLYLPMKLFLWINGSTEGVVLYFRCLFVLCQTVVSTFTFCKLKKYGTFPALISSLLFLLYVPEEVKMLDYYTMSLMGFQVVALVLFCTQKLKSYHYLFAGIVFACAVTAQPFNCLIYFIYSANVLYYILTKNKREPSEIKEKFLTVKPWLCITAGIVCVAVAFCVFLFSQITFSEFIGNLGNLFGGHDHTLPFSQTTGKTDMFSYFTIVETLFDLFPVGFTLSVLLFIALFFDKERLKNRISWIITSSVVLGILMLEYFYSFTQTPVSLLFRPYILFIITAVSLILTEKKEKNLSLICFSGVAYVVFLGIISQALDYIGVIGLVISNCVLAPSLSRLYNEINPDKDNAKPGKRKPLNVKNQKALSKVCVVISFIILFDIVIGASIKLFDDPAAPVFGRELVSADVVIDKGPFKGINVSSDISDSYNNILSDLDEIKENSCESVLVAGLIPWIYFYFDGAPATFTTWYIADELDLYDNYYRNENKIPQCIYVPKTEFYRAGDHTDEAASQEELFSQMFSADSGNGKSGYIIYVN